MQKFKEQNPDEKFIQQGNQMELMQQMMQEIKELKAKFLSSNTTTNGTTTNTAGESKTSQEVEGTGESVTGNDKQS